MKAWILRKSRFVLVATGLMVIGSPALALDDWQTIADFQILEGYGCQGRELGTDASGTSLFTVGYVKVDSTVTMAAVLKQSPLGWTVVDLAGEGNDSLYRTFAADPSAERKRLYAGGRVRWETRPTWFVRRSPDGGQEWLDADRFEYGLRSYCEDLAVDMHGTVYAVGSAARMKLANDDTWIVRTSRDAGVTWTMPELLQAGKSAVFASAQAVVCHPGTDTVFVGGTLPGKGTQRGWGIRRSVSGGAWKTVDFVVGDGRVTDLHVGAGGVVYAVGRDVFGADWTWIVRKSLNNGDTWETIDVYVHELGSSPWCVRTDAIGTVYVAGGPSSAATGHGFWLVRKLVAGTSAWETSDAYESGAGPVYGMTSDIDGSLFTTGSAKNEAGQGRWLIRALTP
jgi:hypothetical protein